MTFGCGCSARPTEPLRRGLVVVVVVVEMFLHGAVKATVANAPQSQLNK